MEILVSTDWLAGQSEMDDIVILDASAHLPGSGRDARAEFDDGHIPGARFLDLPSLTDETSSVPKALPRKDQVEQRLGQLGVRSDQKIVLYDNSMLRSSARAFLILNMMGIAEIAILDGGLEKWRAENRPVISDCSEYAPGTFLAPEDNRDFVRSKADMLANCDAGTEQVVDARDAARFTGESVDTVHGLAGGHIPDARNLFFRELLNDDGTFLPRAEIEAAFRNAGIDPEKPLVASCGSGMTASVLLFGHRLLGHNHGALYDGSWAEWGTDPDTPKQTGKGNIG